MKPKLVLTPRKYSANTNIFVLLVFMKIERIKVKIINVCIMREVPLFLRTENIIKSFIASYF